MSVCMCDLNVCAHTVCNVCVRVTVQRVSVCVLVITAHSVRVCRPQAELILEDLGVQVVQGSQAALHSLSLGHLEGPGDLEAR